MAKRQSIPHFNNFPALMEGLVLPHLQAHPEYERLDGLSGKGNRAKFATFEHQGLKWKIAMDTKIGRLLAAWKLYQEGKEPFVQGNTGQRLCLRLNDGGTGKANGLFVYAV
jgi:hypothetical protein